MVAAFYMENRNKQRRPIRSYVLRQGRLTAGQQRAFESLWPRFGVEFSGQQLDLQTLFGNDQPVYVEIGFGNGDSLAEMAAAHPQYNYLGIEVHSPGVGHLLLKIEELGLENVRILRHDAVEVLAQSIGDAQLAGVFLFFPDPWHKKRHHKRRILQPPLISQLARVIQPGGVFHAATDWENYAEHMLDTLSDAAQSFSNAAGPGCFSERPDYRPLTKFEQRGQRLGHGVWDLIFHRL
jgi:tRNA (guanine-N7-)-methyltransferase